MVKVRARAWKHKPSVGSKLSMDEPAVGCESEHGCQDLQHNVGALFALSGFACPEITLDGSGFCDVGPATWVTDMTCQCGRW